MPEARVVFQKNTFSDAELKRLKASLKIAIAHHMHCKDDELEEFDPDKHIDLGFFPYQEGHGDYTAVMLVTIITYGAPSRLTNLNDRLRAIRDYVLTHNRDLLEAKRKPIEQTVSPGCREVMQDAISITFLPKPWGTPWKRGWVCG